MEKICLNCPRRFTCNQGKRKFCSMSCSTVYKRAHKIGWYTQTMETKSKRTIQKMAKDRIEDNLVNSALQTIAEWEKEGIPVVEQKRMEKTYKESEEDTIDIRMVDCIKRVSLKRAREFFDDTIDDVRELL